MCDNPKYGFYYKINLSPVYDNQFLMFDIQHMVVQVCVKYPELESGFRCPQPILCSISVVKCQVLNYLYDMSCIWYLGKLYIVQDLMQC